MEHFIVGSLSGAVVVGIGHINLKFVIRIVPYSSNSIIIHTFYINTFLQKSRHGTIYPLIVGIWID